MKIWDPCRLCLAQALLRVPTCFQEVLSLAQGSLIGNGLMEEFRSHCNHDVLCAPNTLYVAWSTAQRSVWWENARQGFLQQRAGWQAGGVGSERGAEGKARPWESKGQSGKARERWGWRRTQTGEWNVGDGELKEPWGIRSRHECEDASIG